MPFLDNQPKNGDLFGIFVNAIREIRALSNQSSGLTTIC